MRFILLLFSFTLGIAFTAHSQPVKNFRLQAGLQYNLAERTFNKKIPSYNRKNEGVGVHLQPTWIMNPHLSLGLNIEYAVVTEDYLIDAVNVFELLSVAPTVRYHFGQHRIRPFVGLGAGIYHSIGHKPLLPFGARAIAGLNAWNIFELSLEYNRIFSELRYNPRAMGDFDNYYIGLKGSFSIGLFHL